MLVKICDVCRMGCNHCLDNACPSGHFMSFSVFKDAIRFCNSYDTLVLLISGGEPTEHPMFWEMLDYAIKKTHDTMIIVTTNGMNLQTDEMYNKVKSYIRYGKKVMFQVTNDPRFYPIRLDNLKICDLPNVFFEDHLIQTYPQGRAVDNGLEYKTKGPKCFNLRSLFRSEGENTSLSALIHFYNIILNKMCAPSILLNGDIVLGESRLCTPCSNIYKNEKEIIDDIRKFKCNKCSLAFESLSDIEKNAIGEL